MSPMATQILSDAELEKLRRFPELSREELVRYFTLMPADESFLMGHRRQGNRLGVAVQLCTLPWLGFVPRRCRVCTGTSGRAAGRPLGYPSRSSLVLRGARPHPDRPPGRGDQVPALAPGWRGRTQGTEIVYQWTRAPMRPDEVLASSAAPAVAVPAWSTG